MRGITVPERTEDFTADPVELFFDLAYVFAFSQLVGMLIHDPTWAGVGKAALLFGLLWLPWSQLTWSANAVSGNGRRVRALFLAGTVVSVPMAASVSTAFEAGGLLFALTLTTIFALGALTMVLSFESESSVHTSAVRWLALNLVSVTVLIVGALVDGDARVALWTCSAAIVIFAMVQAGRGEWLIRTGHMAERHGLIVIVALGEVIVAIGIPVVGALEGGEGIPGRTVTVLVAAGLFAALLWWSYFDRPGPALEHRGADVDGDRERGRYVRDVYTAAHAFIVAGIVSAAAALEEIALHPTDEVPVAFRSMFFGGLALSVLGVSIAIWRAFRVVPRERVVAIVGIGAFIALAGSLDGVLIVLVVDVIIIATIVSEHVRIER